MSWCFRHFSIVGLILILCPSVRLASAVTEQTGQPESNSTLTAQWSEEKPAGDFPDLRLTVLIYNYASIPQEITAKAYLRAAAIFRQTGIQIQWIDNATFKTELGDLVHGPGKLASIEVTLRLLSHSRAALKGSALGEALPCQLGRDACIANVFLDRITQKTLREEIGIAEILGHAIAHEMGHILLGSNSHHSDGIMQAQWGKTALNHASKGKLVFTTDQSGTMRGKLLAHIMHLQFEEKNETVIGSASR
jgi:hypothetical protein